MAKSITNKEFLECLKKGSCEVVDVRNPDEYNAQYITRSKNIPLDTIENNQNDTISRDKPVYIICRSGRRSQRACDVLQARGFDNLINVEGGMQECIKLKGPVVQVSKTLPLMRQVQISAGLLIVLGMALAQWVHPAGLFMSLFVGLGLIFAGVTGYCGMGILLEKMPWNKKLICKPCHLDKSGVT